MKIRRQGKTAATTVDFGDCEVLFSYSTPVAANVYGEGFYRTSKHFSVTTSKHINKWLEGRTAQEKPQEFFEDLVSLSKEVPTDE